MPAEARVYHARSIDARCRSIATRRCRCPTARRDRRRDRRDARLQASLPALPDRAGLRRPVPRRAGGRRAGRHRAQVAAGRRAHHLRRSRISSTARRTRGGSSKRCTRGFPRVTYDATIKVEHLLAHRAAAAGAGADRLPVRHQRGRSRSTTTCSRSSRRATRARTSSPRRRLCRDAGLALVADVRRVHAVDDDRRLPRSAGRRRRRSDLVEHVAPVQWGIRLLVTHGNRGCSSSHDIQRAGRPFDATTLTYPWTHRRSARRPAAGSRSWRWSACGASGARARRSSLPSARLARRSARSCRRSRSAIPYLNEPWYC